MKSWLGLLLATVAFAHSVNAAGPPDYIRFAEDRGSSRLELAIRTFAMPSGQKVDLIGVVHIADAPYYQELNRRLEAYDSVLFELVGDPERLTRGAPAGADPEIQPGGGAIGFLQQAASRHLALSFQLDAIDYSRQNMVHADVSAADFGRMQQERGETMLTLFTRAMQAQMSGQANTAAMNELNTFALIRIFMSPDSAAEFKRALAKMLAQTESLTVAMEGQGGTAMLTGRNEVALRKLEEVLAQKRQRRVAVFYGGAHMPGIETALLKDGAQAVGEEWLAAWTIPRTRAAVTPKP